MFKKYILNILSHVALDIFSEIYMCVDGWICIYTYIYVYIYVYMYMYNVR